MRAVLVAFWLMVLFSGIAYLLWYNEWKYTLPTPVPQNYAVVKTGTAIDLSDCVKYENNKPVFIHFFNPDCACSRFNIPHFNSLVKKYGEQITFSVVVINQKKEFTAEEIQQRFDLEVPVVFDTAMAALCGVYSTPQAVILDRAHMLYYRGNYNKTRYCTEKSSMYAQMAIDSLLNNNQNPVFSALALQAYGCSLPMCTK